VKTDNDRRFENVLAQVARVLGGSPPLLQDPSEIVIVSQSPHADEIAIAVQAHDEALDVIKRLDVSGRLGPHVRAMIANRKPHQVLVVVVFRDGVIMCDYLPLPAIGSA
jgi:hypothetical protein